MTYAASGLGVRIGRATLLDDVSIEVSPGEIVAVAGPNGAGKSTLLGVLAGDRLPSDGTAMLDERAVADWPKVELARRRAVMGTDQLVAFAFSAAEVAMLGRMPLHGGDQSAPTGGTREDLLSVRAAQPFDRRGPGARDVQPRASRFAQRLRHRDRPRFRLKPVRVMNQYLHQPHQWRVTQRAAVADLALEESLEVLIHRLT